MARPVSRAASPYLRCSRAKSCRPAIASVSLSVAYSLGHEREGYRAFLHSLIDSLLHAQRIGGALAWWIIVIFCREDAYTR